MAKETYNHTQIEKEAQDKWAKLNLYQADLEDQDKDPYYLLVEFPYPSGDLHTGHWYAYAMPDIYARYLRSKGKNVLFPIGFDAFGLPAENAAIKRGLDPKKWTYENMDNMRTQLRRMGTSFDWAKEVVTCDPDYYKWTQWLFAKLFEHGLAERRLAPVKWCPVDQTVLANEQVIDGHCERCGSEVEEKNLTQWFLKITSYAERLLQDLEPLPWREEIKDAQRAWIGKSEGARLTFQLQAALNDDAGVVNVFTTRPETIFGATYIVLAPEHPLVETLTPLILNKEAVDSYRAKTKLKTERERSENKEKTGVVLEGITAINPANNQPIPVFIADYVLASYGTGAVMAVPAHDERDFAFAKKMNLPLCPVIAYSVVNEHNPPIPGKPDTKRNVIHAILRDPKTNTVLVGFLKDESWGDRKPVNFIIGGVEEGESWQDAAAREITEETGYTDFTFEQEIPLEVNAFFYQAQKEVNRDSHVRTFVFTLNSDAHTSVDSAENAKHEFKWLKEDEVAAHLNIPTDQLVWKYLYTGGFAHTGDGRLVNSGQFSGLQSEEAKWDIVTFVGGERVTNFRIRDWLVSRQRYWGCPIPVVYDPEGNPHLVPSEHLPWTLPTDVDFTPSDKSPLATSKELHERVERIFGQGWTPEYDTLDTFVDSSWYYLRYLDPHDTETFSDQKKMKRWIPVDRYSGGSEHTTMHLLYARFFHKALHDLALTPTPEPFNERFNRGLILGPDGQKMSKSKGNVINPDELVAKYGADAVRTYLAFIGPYNEPGQYPWNLDGVEAMRRFLDRVTTLSQKIEDREPNTEERRALSKAMSKAAADIERFKFNTAISALMVALKTLEAERAVSRAAFVDFIIMLAPFAPHLGEHLWEIAEQEGSVHEATWPQSDESFEDDQVSVVVQINGKRRAHIMLSRDASEEEALEKAKELDVLANITLDRVVYVPNRILNIVSSSKP